MRRLTGSRALVTDQRDAIDKLEGMPLAPSFVGSAIRYLVPATYSAGALGWTEHMCGLIVSNDGLTATLDVANDIAERHQGKAVNLDGRIVTVNLLGAVDVPGAFAARGRA